MTTALVCVADGSEEMEVVISVDVLRRAGIDVTLASVPTEQRAIVASRKVSLLADDTIGNCVNRDWDLVVLPGGMPGAENLAACEELQSLLVHQLASNKWLAAICAAPAVVLGRKNLLSGYRATCFPSFQQELAHQVRELSTERVVVDKNLVTSQGPGTAFEFALTLVELLLGTATRQALADAMVL